MNECTKFINFIKTLQQTNEDGYTINDIEAVYGEPRNVLTIRSSQKDHIIAIWWHDDSSSNAIWLVPKGEIMESSVFGFIDAIQLLSFLIFVPDYLRNEAHLSVVTAFDKNKDDCYHQAEILVIVGIFTNGQEVEDPAKELTQRILDSLTHRETLQ